MTISDLTHGAKELDARNGDGIDVRLLWHPAINAVTVEVFDSSNEDSFELAVDPHDALDAFRHPFAYAAAQGIAFLTPRRAYDDEPIAA